MSNSTGKNILMASNDFQEKILRVGWHTKYNAAISFGIPSLYVNLLFLPSATSCSSNAVEGGLRKLIALFCVPAAMNAEEAKCWRVFYFPGVVLAFRASRSYSLSLNPPCQQCSSKK